ncbi:MAG: M42 family peptidase [Anaerolineae bacterium]|nr:M42 family peptidase [Anaerolineae bacterium]
MDKTTISAAESTLPSHPPIELLEKLSNALAVSGDEGAVRKIVLEEIKPHASQVTVDALGNVLAQAGNLDNPKLRVMLAAHMDEVGLMIMDKEEEGIYRFATVGGIDARHLVGKPVWIGDERVPGIIGTRPIHLLQEEDLKRAIPLENLRIDVGFEKDRVKVGNRAAFATPFQQVGPSLCGKALDDRLGVAILIELIKHAPKHIALQAAFTVQEEIHLRGAHTAAYALAPHLAIVIDATPAWDLPTWDGSENVRYNTRLDAGPAIYIADEATLYDPRLIRYLAETAEKHQIPYQYRQPGKGATDAGSIHRKRAGIPTVAVSVPIRYPHTPISVCRLADWQNTFQLLHHALAEIDPVILQQER